MARPLTLRRTSTGQVRPGAFHYVLDGDVPALTHVWVTTPTGAFVAEEFNPAPIPTPSRMEAFYVDDETVELHSEPISGDDQFTRAAAAEPLPTFDDPLVITALGPHEIRIAGELDMVTEGQLTQAIESLRADVDCMVVIDFAGITFMDSMGLRCLLRAELRGEIVLRNVRAHVMTMLKLMGMAEHFTVV